MLTIVARLDIRPGSVLSLKQEIATIAQDNHIVVNQSSDQKYNGCILCMDDVKTVIACKPSLARLIAIA